MQILCEGAASEAQQVRGSEREAILESMEQAPVRSMVPGPVRGMTFIDNARNSVNAHFCSIVMLVIIICEICWFTTIGLRGNIVRSRRTRSASLPPAKGSDDSDYFTTPPSPLKQEPQRLSIDVCC